MRVEWRNCAAVRRTVRSECSEAAVTEGVEPGAGMAADIAEQPTGFARLLDERADAIAEVAAQIARRRPRFVVYTARGTSDHAALYAAYLTEIRLGIPIGLASPSAITVYGARPDFSDSLVIGVSQSGGSPDLVEVIDVAAGHERAVAATKTYTAELFALHMLVEGVRGGDGRLPAGERAGLARLPELARGLIEDSTATELASRYRFAERLITTGRGYAYPTARETALKLMETSYLAALAFSGADLLHGPLAMADPDVPVLAMVGGGAGGESMRAVLQRLGERRADVVSIGPRPAAGLHIPTPDVDERYAPLLDIIPMQQLALALALLKGEDPDAPRGLRKVTETR